MNTKNLLIAITAGFILNGATWTYAQSSMTDKQVLEYVLNALKSGKDQQTIAIELARRGVTEEQAYRVKSLYEEQMASGSLQGGSQTQTSKSRSRSLSGQTDESSYVGRDFDVNSRSRSSRLLQSSHGSGQTTDNNAYVNPFDHSAVGNAQSQTMRQGYNPNTGNRLTPQNERMAQKGTAVAENIFGEREQTGLGYNGNPEDQIWGRNIFNNQFLLVVIKL